MSITKSEIKDMIRDAIREQIQVQQSNSKLEQELFSDHIVHCPECYQQAIETLNKTSEVVCEKCGLPLGSEKFAKQLNSCPNCHQTKARRIERR